MQYASQFNSILDSIDNNALMCTSRASMRTWLNLVCRLAGLSTPKAYVNLKSSRFKTGQFGG